MTTPEFEYDWQLITPGEPFESVTTGRQFGWADIGAALSNAVRHVESMGWHVYAVHAMLPTCGFIFYKRPAKVRS